MSWMFIAVGVSLLGTPAPAQRTERPLPTLAVLDVQSTGVATHLIPLLTELIATEVEKAGGYRLVVGREVNGKLGVSDQAFAINCTDEECILDVGGALGVDYVLASHVGRVGSTHVMHLKLIDVRERRTLQRAYKTIHGGEDMLLDAIGSTARTLFVDIRDAEAKLDATQSPKPQPSELATGAAGDGPTTPAQGEVPAGDLPSDQLPLARATADTDSWRPLPWALAATGVLAAGAGSYFGWATRQHYFDAKNSEGGTRQVQIDAGRKSQRLANVSFVVAGSALVTSALVYWLGGNESSDEASTKTGLVILPAGAGLGVSGRW